MSDKQFPPSIKRLKKARKDGKGVKNQLVSYTLQWWVLSAFINGAFAWVRNGTLVQWMRHRVWTPEEAISESLWIGFSISLTAVGTLAVSGLLAGLMQQGVLFSPGQLVMGLKQSGLRSFLGKIQQNALSATLGPVRCGLVVLALVPVLVESVSLTPSSFDGVMTSALGLLFEKLHSVCIRGGVALTVIAGGGYCLAHWRFFRRHKMSLQELKDEYREEEGDPHSKSHRKHEHRALLFSEVEKRVKQSKVVIIRRMRLGEPNRVQ